VKTLVQCDFDGTIVEGDIGFRVLRSFASEDWRRLLTEYRAGRISVGSFNTGAFAMVKADRQTLLEFVVSKYKIRDGFQELVAYCRREGFKFTIVSNGLVFYIEAILKHIGIDNIDILAAQAEFTPEGIEARYIGPKGNLIQDGFKDTYLRSFLSEGYRVVYIGNGLSDASPARQAYHVFATGGLLEYCKKMNLNHTPFVDLNDVVSGLELLL
jgi:2-hydroxy-3-keto-5-methylthiopentenyl-1-phosphate phosphatase